MVVPRHQVRWKCRPLGPISSPRPVVPPGRIAVRRTKIRSPNSKNQTLPSRLEAVRHGSDAARYGSPQRGVHRDGARKKGRVHLAYGREATPQVFVLPCGAIGKPLQSRKVLSGRSEYKWAILDRDIRTVPPAARHGKGCQSGITFSRRPCYAKKCLCRLANRSATPAAFAHGLREPPLARPRVDQTPRRPPRRCTPASGAAARNKDRKALIAASRRGLSLQ